MGSRSSGETVTAGLILSYRDSSGKIATKWGPRVVIAGKAPKTYLLPLDSTFNLGDAEYHIWQLKLTLTTANVAGKKVEVEFTDFQIDTLDNLSGGDDKPEITVHPPLHHAAKAPANAMKIYFHFDNQDCMPTTVRGVTDRLPYPGFREILLETVKEQAVLADSPESADLIVYAAARPEPEMAARIAGAVKGGTPLYVGAVTADPEIDALLPVNSTPVESKGIPERKQVKPESAADPLFRGLNNASFGVYRNIVLKDGKVRLAFADGSPAVVEGIAGKGRVLYSALGIGVDLIPGKATYDPFLLRAASELTGKALREEPRPRPAVKDGWQMGASKDNFGRFGIILGDGLLTESISNSLAVTNGMGQYEFRAESAPRIRLTDWQLKPISGTPAEKPGEITWDHQYAQESAFSSAGRKHIPTEPGRRNASLSFSRRRSCRECAR